MTRCLGWAALVGTGTQKDVSSAFTLTAAASKIPGHVAVSLSSYHAHSSNRPNVTECDRLLESLEDCFVGREKLAKDRS